MAHVVGSVCHDECGDVAASPEPGSGGDRATSRPGTSGCWWVVASRGSTAGWGSLSGGWWWCWLFGGCSVGCGAGQTRIGVPGIRPAGGLCGYGNSARYGDDHGGMRPEGVLGASFRFLGWDDDAGGRGWSAMLVLMRPASLTRRDCQREKPLFPFLLRLSVAGSPRVASLGQGGSTAVVAWW